MSLTTKRQWQELHICETKKPCRFRALAAPPLPPPPGPWLVVAQSQHRVLEPGLAALCLVGRRAPCALCTGLPAWGLWRPRQRPSMPRTAVGLGHFPPARQVRSGEYVLSACQSVFISHHAGNMAALERAVISVSLVRIRVAASYVFETCESYLLSSSLRDLGDVGVALPASVPPPHPLPTAFLCARQVAQAVHAPVPLHASDTTGRGPLPPTGRRLPSRRHCREPPRPSSPPLFLPRPTLPASRAAMVPPHPVDRAWAAG